MPFGCGLGDTMQPPYCPAAVPASIAPRRNAARVFCGRSGAGHGAGLSVAVIKRRPGVRAPGRCALVYFEDEAGGHLSMKRLTRDVARRIAANIAKLLDLLRQAPID